MGVSGSFDPVPRWAKTVSFLRLAAIPAAMIVALIAAWKLGYFDLDRRRELVEAVGRLRATPGAELAYVVGFGVAIAFLLPSWIATLVGGALFGVWKGALLAWMGALCGTVLAHLVARGIARKPVQRLFGSHRMLLRLREHDDVMELLRLRVLPLAPFAVLDYAAGISGASLRRLFLATMLGTIPAALAYAYVGSQLVRGIISERSASRQALLIAAGVSVSMWLLSLAPALVRRLRE